MHDKITVNRTGRTSSVPDPVLNDQFGELDILHRVRYSWKVLK